MIRMIVIIMGYIRINEEKIFSGYIENVYTTHSSRAVN